MIRHLIVLYMALVSLLVIGPDPLPILPLLLVSLSFITEKKWLGLIGLLLYGLIGLSRVEDVSMSDPVGFGAISLAMLIPMLIMLELIIAGRPYRIERVSLSPLLKITGLLLGFSLLLLIVIRISRIGIYLNSDPAIQVFILMALSILFTGPILLSTRTTEEGD